MKTRRLFLFSMILVLLWGGLGCAGSQPTATPALPTPQPAFMPPTADTPRAVPPPAATPAPGTTASLISEIVYFDLGAPNATIIWKTRVPTIGRIEYGPHGEYVFSTPWSEKLSTSDGFTLDGLEPDAPLWIRVRVKDAAGNESVKEERIWIWRNSVYDTYTLRWVLDHPDWMLTPTPEAR